MHATTGPVRDIRPGDQIKVEDSWALVLDEPLADDGKVYVRTNQGSFGFEDYAWAPMLVSQRHPSEVPTARHAAPEPRKGISRADERILWVCALLAVSITAWVLLVASWR